MAKLKTFKANYTQVSNVWLKDKNLSAKAKGIICFLQSLEDGWEYSIAGLATQFKDGSDSIKSAIDELRNAGYIVWERSRNTDGTLGVTTVEITEKPNVENPNLVKPVLGKQPQQIINKQIIKEQNKNNNTIVLAKADKYGKPEINDCFLKWKEIVGYPITSKTAANRNACNNLIRKHNVEGVERLIRGVAKSQEDKFAPRISDFITLQAKQNDLLAWGKRKITGEVKGVIRI